MYYCVYAVPPKRIHDECKVCQNRSKQFAFMCQRYNDIDNQCYWPTMPTHEFIDVILSVLLIRPVSHSVNVKYEWWNHQLGASIC